LCVIQTSFVVVSSSFVAFGILRMLLEDGLMY